MAIAEAIRANLGHSSWIRRMFEEGRRLKEAHGADAVFDFSLGNPDLEPPDAFVAALARVASSHEAGTHAYMPNAGYTPTRAFIAARVGAEHGVSLCADDVLMTVGAAGGLNVALHTILNPGDEVVVTRPYFAEYGFYVTNHQGVLRDVEPGPGFSLSPESVRKALRPETAAVIVNSPNNPTGRVYARAQIEALARVLAEHGDACGRRPYLIVDEPYRSIVYDGVSVPPILDAYSETIVVSSFSKSLSVPGERIGYIALAPGIRDRQELLDGLTMSNRVLGFVNAPALMQRALVEAGACGTDISRYRARRGMLCAALDGAGIEYAMPEGAFYLFCKVPEAPMRQANAIKEETIDVSFVMHLKRYLILGVPGLGFGYPGWFRLCYCVPERVISGVAASLKQAVLDWKQG